MKKACIISIGDEILSGRTCDTNAAFLSAALLEAGITTNRHLAVPDRVDSIVQALNQACADSDFVLITGGLGPTADDLTRPALSEFLDVELVLDENLLARMQEFFAERGLKMAETNLSQAYFPKGSEAIINREGTAPGIKARCRDTFIAAMPGVPSEMRQMFHESVMPQIRSAVGDAHISVKTLKCFGTGESNIASILGNLMDRDCNPLVNSTVAKGVITLTVIAQASTARKAARLVEDTCRQIHAKLGNIVYGTDEETLAEVLGRRLAEKKSTLAVAESCTGGLISKFLTDIPGSSRYFTYGWITYSNQAKISQLGVDAETIKKYGAVSQQVAEQMADGARTKAGADFAVSVTGIAGPGGETNKKKAGLVYISIKTENYSQTKQFQFPYDRENVRTRAALTALNMLRLHPDV